MVGVVLFYYPLYVEVRLVVLLAGLFSVREWYNLDDEMEKTRIVSFSVAVQQQQESDKNRLNDDLLMLTSA